MWWQDESVQSRGKNRRPLTFTYPVERSDEVVVADDGQADERVDADQDVEEEAAVLAEGRAQQGVRELLYGGGRAVDPAGAESRYPVGGFLFLGPLSRRRRGRRTLAGLAESHLLRTSDTGQVV